MRAWHVRLVLPCLGLQWWDKEKRSYAHMEYHWKRKGILSQLCLAGLSRMEGEAWHSMIARGPDHSTCVGIERLLTSAVRFGCTN